VVWRLGVACHSTRFDVVGVRDPTSIHALPSHRFKTGGAFDLRPRLLSGLDLARRQAERGAPGKGRGKLGFELSRIRNLRVDGRHLRRFCFDSDEESELIKVTASPPKATKGHFNLSGSEAENSR